MTSNKDESPRFEMVSFDSCAGVDTQTISYQAERLEVLGFEHEADYCLSNPEKHEELNRRGIERELFGHPKSFWAGDEVPASHAA